MELKSLPRLSCLFVDIVMLTGVMMLMIDDQLLDFVGFLANLLYHGAQRNNLWFPDPVQRQNIGV